MLAALIVASELFLPDTEGVLRSSFLAVPFPPPTPQSSQSPQVRVALRISESSEFPPIRASPLIRPSAHSCRRKARYARRFASRPLGIYSFDASATSHRPRSRNLRIFGGSSAGETCPSRANCFAPRVCTQRRYPCRYPRELISEYRRRYRSPCKFDYYYKSIRKVADPRGR